MSNTLKWDRRLNQRILRNSLKSKKKQNKKTKQMQTSCFNRLDEKNIVQIKNSSYVVFVISSFDYKMRLLYITLKREYGSMIKQRIETKNRTQKETNKRRSQWMIWISSLKCKNYFGSRQAENIWDAALSRTIRRGCSEKFRRLSVIFSLFFFFNK